jgi:hypothetical protein
MGELNLEEEKKKAISFKEYNTYVFVQTCTNIYNGYICQVEEEVFFLMDDEIPAPFPIRFDSLKAPIVPSKKGWWK